MEEIKNYFIERCEFDKKCDPQLSLVEFINGGKHLRYQCTTCGIIQGNPVSKKGKDLTTIPEADKAKLEEYQAKMRSRALSFEEWSIVMAKVRQAQKENRENAFFKMFNIKCEYFSQAYEIYMNSDYWCEKRKKILLRDNYTCRICKVEKAIDVHHISYQNLGDESEIELLSVCRPCHELIHNKMQEAKDKGFQTILF